MPLLDRLNSLFPVKYGIYADSILEHVLLVAAHLQMSNTAPE